ncbi:MAG: ATP-binding cassette domain-containing protein [Chitinivibrionales bacterium]|nr:ATP-binding cassette domain-containing protein [Chitinivibrionales bacterium]
MTTGTRTLEEGPRVPFWATIYGFVKPYRRKLLLSILLAMFVGVTVALQPICVKWIIDEGVLRKGPDGDLLPTALRIRYALVFVGAYLALSTCRMLVGVRGVYFMVDGIEQFLCDLRGRFFRHVQNLCFRFHDQASSGELFNYIMGSPLQSLKMFLHQGAVMLPISVVSWVVALITLTTFHWLMALITFATVIAVVVTNRRSWVVIKEMSHRFMETESSVSKYVADMLRGTRAVKIYAIEDNVSSFFEHQARRMRNEGARLGKRRTLEHAKAEAAQYAGMAVIYGSGAYLCLFGDLEVGAFFAFVGSITTLMHSLMGIMQLNLVRANAEAGLTRIVRVLQLEQSTPEVPPEKAVAVEKQNGVARSHRMPCVQMRGVRFGYDGNGPVLTDIDVTIPDGQSVALVGPSGSGKSTFVSLLLRLYDIWHGEILLNGVDLRSYPQKELRACFGVVPQDPFIFQTSLLNNITVTRPEATMEEVHRALDIAYVKEFVDTLPHGLDTEVGEGGANLSGGQRQRIAIARAVLAAPRYYVFDEATSALDNDSERRIQAAMEALMEGHTTFVIAHRLSTIRNVDRILVFDKGRIVQDGAYDTLAGQDGLFRELLASAQGSAAA